MVPGIAGRPLTLERYTKGLAGGGFFQKHYQKHFPAWIDSVSMSGGGKKTTKKTAAPTPGVIVYPICNDQRTLVYLANQGTIAFHVGTARKGALDAPDEIVFDLDPPVGEDGWNLARRTAHAIRELMEEVGLTAFVKTSGSKGLHLFVPIDGTSTYEEVTDFCKRANAELVGRHPDLVTTEFYKKDRGGRLFLDTLRNGHGATVVAAWSVRGKPTAPVSTPIAWDEVDDPALLPDGIKLRDVAARLAKHGDPWAKLHENPGNLDAASEKLGA
jgi:bifunctional non-homologous end joining protein LigD